MQNPKTSADRNPTIFVLFSTLLFSSPLRATPPLHQLKINHGSHQQADPIHHPPTRFAGAEQHGGPAHIPDPARLDRHGHGRRLSSSGSVLPLFLLRMRSPSLPSDVPQRYASPLSFPAAPPTALRPLPASVRHRPHDLTIFSGGQGDEGIRVLRRLFERFRREGLRQGDTELRARVPPELYRRVVGGARLVPGLPLLGLVLGGAALSFVSFGSRGKRWRWWPVGEEQQLGTRSGAGKGRKHGEHAAHVQLLILFAGGIYTCHARVSTSGFDSAKERNLRKKKQLPFFLTLLQIKESPSRIILSMAQRCVHATCV